jgi:transcriptional regulator with XRE-family HTH domain
MTSFATPPAAPKVTPGALFGRVVEHHRKRAHIDQAVVAAALGVTQSAYSRLEWGQSGMTVTQLWKVAACLGLPPSRLILDVERYADRLRQQGVEIVEGKAAAAGLLIGLGILAALIAVAN